MAKLTRNDNGEYPAYAWPGGYPIFYLTEDDSVLCPKCANGPDASEDNEDSQWNLIDTYVNWEDDNLYCDHRNEQIESAYGD